MGVAERVAAARATKRGNRIKDGDGEYLFLILEHRALEKGKDAWASDTWVAEFLVLEAAQQGEYYAQGEECCWPNDPGATKVVPNAVGTTCSFVSALDSSPAAAGNVKQYILTIAGVSEADLDVAQIKVKAEGKPDPYANMINQLADRSQPMRGALIRCKTVSKTTRGGKNAGKRGCYPTFVHVPRSGADIEATARLFAESKERRRLLDAGVTNVAELWPTKVTAEQIAAAREQITKTAPPVAA